MLVHLLAGGVGVAAGLIAHLGFFIKGEWHVRAPEIFVFHATLYPALAFGVVFYQGSHLGELLQYGLIACVAYLSTLLASILAYRIWFHPLTKAGFKGPLWMRTSKIWHVWVCRTSQNHLFLDKLYKDYGEFIRTGPSEITTYHPDVFAVTDGPRTECGKAEWYDLLYPESSLLTTRERSLHDARRRQWKKCFTPQELIENYIALTLHFSKTLNHVDNLERLIDGHIKAGKPCEMRDMAYWFGFDVMGDFVFNKSFRMLSDGKWHHMVVRLQKALGLLGPIGDWFHMTGWTHKQINARLEDGFEKQPQPDLVHYLLETSDQPRTAEEILRMRGDSLNAIVAGSEPIPVVILGLFAELAKQPQYIDRVYAEIKDADLSNTQVLSMLPELNAVINEALRLYPVLPTAGPRKTGESGVTIGGVFIPPHVTIVNPRYTIHRREDCFDKALHFVPERWTTRREMIHNIAAYNPWGTAHHSCIARVMAIDVLRVVTARLIKRYQFALAPGETGDRVLSDMKDQLAPNPGHLQLVFQLR
ncbi:hypothetical protein G7054_g8695 [Neopestalotiopsis clavispora]|nr:hypothetical protein G7054_g8695 [Neopestalotiopsis clavispora]